MATKLAERSETVTAIKEELWGMLEPKHLGSQAYELVKATTRLGRLAANDIVISSNKVSGTHCTIEHDAGRVFITDSSGNGTFLNHNRLPKGVRTELRHNDLIWLLHESIVQPAQTIGFKLVLASVLAEQKEAEEKRKKEEEAKMQLEKKATEEDQLKKKHSENLSDKLRQQLSCAMCLQIIYLPVTVHPCNHHFCGACLTGWIKKSEQCPQCRKPLLTAQRDASWYTLIENFLKANPKEEKSAEEKEADDKNNIFKFQTYYFSKKEEPKPAPPPAPAPLPARGRRRVVRRDSDLSAEDEPQGLCAQCTNPRNGFKCPPRGPHFKCDNCGKMFANRQDNLQFQQQCAICEKAFCNLYTKDCKGKGVSLHLVTNKHPKKPLPMDVGVVRGNRYQFDLYWKVMNELKLDSKGLFDEMMDYINKNKFAFIQDKKISQNPNLKVSKEVEIKPQTPVCENCWRELWFQLVFTWMTIRRDRLPKEAQDRPNCYWGVNCRSVRSNPDHARKLNHICFQTRFDAKK